MIAKMLEQFADEVGGAEEYLRCAGAETPTEPMYREMAQQELGHAEKLAEGVRNELGRRADDPKLGKELSAAVEKMLADRLAELRGEFQ